jgi:hypothetical protein
MPRIFDHTQQQDQVAFPNKTVISPWQQAGFSPNNEQKQAPNVIGDSIAAAQRDWRHRQNPPHTPPPNDDTAMK